VEVDYPWRTRAFSIYFQQYQKNQQYQKKKKHDRLSIDAALTLLATETVVLHGGLSWSTKSCDRMSDGILSGALAITGTQMVLLTTIKFFEADQTAALCPQHPEPSQHKTGRLTL